MYGKVIGITLMGVTGFPVTVEAVVGRGLPSLSITGLPGASVQDARERVRPAVESAGFEWPLRRVVVNLSPVNLRKDGPGLDLPIALGVLVATGQVPAPAAARFAFAGELSLRGDLMPTPGVLTVALAAHRRRLEGVVVPAGNAAEAGLVEGLQVVAARDLREVVGFFRGSWKPDPAQQRPAQGSAAVGVDLADVRGQGQAKRAMEVAAAGGHNLLMVGSPGSGKTMLARRFPTVLPSLGPEESLEVTQLHSVAGLLGEAGLLQERPFRAPHHSVSMAGLLGGGSGGLMRPGEVSLAHRGVLFLDELNEFRRDAIEGLRQPLEDGRVVVTRAHGAVEFPARFTLIAAANPCPCGYEGDTLRGCTCPPHRVAAYRQKLSGPLLDRVDLRLSVPRLSPAELLDGSPGESSAVVRDRVEEARSRQMMRLAPRFRHNAEVPGHIARRDISLSEDASSVLERAASKLGLTGRGFDRAIKVARTIADLAGEDRVGAEHLVEALSYRAGTREPAGV